MTSALMTFDPAMDVVPPAKPQSQTPQQTARGQGR